ncbi:MAG: NAD(P)-binding domain-containing protein [Streptococcaceae bacterium]|jgi:3-hydroxyisobutyrate dehydrogenase-like beta-hydroxyacid dehydrogenase|nr:NAD(P)-binding domain-containing protein [Streptococcaceae bacterium]
MEVFRMKIAIIGTGTIGTIMGKALLKIGMEVIVFNRTASRTKELVDLGAIAASGVSQAISESDAAIILVMDANAVHEVLFNEETKSNLNGKNILIGTTTSVKEIEDIATKGKELGAKVSQASIMLMPPEADNQHGYFLLGAEETDKIFWREVLTNIAEVYHLGKVGEASKAETPMLISAALTSMSLIIPVAIALKLNLPEPLIMKQFSAMVPGSDLVVNQLLEKDYSNGISTVEGFMKAIYTAIDTVREQGMETNLLDSLLDIYKKAIEKGLSDKAETSVLEILLG